MKDNTKQTLVAIILVILVIIVLIVSNLFNNSTTKNNKISILTDYNKFYTVNSCIYRVITYINSRDEESLNLVISDEYKKKNNIKQGIINIFSDIPDNATFVSKKMYYQEITANITKYYVYGYINQNLLEEFDTISQQNNKHIYFIVYLDSENLTFTIEPYNGKIFDGGNSND